MADDLKGGWTNRYSTDYSCRFQTRGILRRNFCTPVFWVSEQLDERTVRSRVWEYLFRFQYQYEHGMPQSLQDHIFQEANIQKQLETLELEWKHSLGRDVLAHAAGLFARHRHSQHYATMFSFLYGDEAAAQFGYPLPGLPPFAGLLLAPALGDV
ncbi:MAG: hypothetical protein D6730_12570 [Bacteroidetes bacterium]|nr:MAG: hypothetical protein D6730_12570 [Bacteroidota bacterium]